MQRKTIDYVKKCFMDMGLTLLEDTYKSVDTPMKCCDKNGYLFYRTLRTVEDMKQKGEANYKHKFSIKNIYCWDNIQHFMETEVDTGTILLTSKEDFRNGDEKLDFLCGNCGAQYKMSWHAFVNVENKVCTCCYRKIRFNADYTEKRRNTFDTYVEKAKEKGYKILSERIMSVKDKIDLEDKYGYRGRMSVSRFLKESGFEKFGAHNPYTLYNLRLLAKQNHSRCYIYDQAIKNGTRSMIKIKCECGNDFMVQLSHFIGGKDKCNECRVKQSKIAQKVEEWLIAYNINYIKEQVFRDCKNNKGATLRFDFYVPEHNLCIEVDGAQHYKPITWHGVSKEKAQQNFEITQQNDQIKNQYCKEHDINLLRLPFWQIENSNDYKTILNNIFFPFKCSELK